MKPLVRWTIGGDVHKNGFLALKLSVESWKKLYGDSHDYCICYNSIQDTSFLEELEVPLIKQENYLDELPVPPISRNPAWKLFPTRLRKNGPEIVVDNDLILHKAMKLEFDRISVTEDAIRYYGAFDRLIKSHININTGMYLLPPHFDLKNEIIKYIRQLSVTDWIMGEDENGHGNEQGLLAYIFLKHNCKFIPKTKISVVLHEFTKGEYGTHFVRLNRNKCPYWDEYVKGLILC